MNQGGSNRLIYDECSYSQYLSVSTSPLQFALDMTKYENCGKCRKDKFIHPYDLVDQESELRNQTRPVSRCGAMKYSPNCKASAQCTYTKDPSVPIVIPPEVCSILVQNIKRRTDPGFRIPEIDPCMK
jgi:hypothetical protein